MELHTVFDHPLLHDRDDRVFPWWRRTTMDRVGECARKPLHRTIHPFLLRRHHLGAHWYPGGEFVLAPICAIYWLQAKLILAWIFLVRMWESSWGSAVAGQNNPPTKRASPCHRSGCLPILTVDYYWLAVVVAIWPIVPILYHSRTVLAIPRLPES